MTQPELPLDKPPPGGAAFPANGWERLLAPELASPWFRDLQTFLDAEYAAKTIHPPRADIYNALKLTPPDAVRVVILGQDPYINPGQAHGLALSVLPGNKPPPSLRNMFKELHDDLGIPVPATGHLASWARQGVLLLNTILTVESGKSLSHAGRGWERLTDALIARLGERRRPAVFLLWGASAQRKAPLITNPAHLVLKSAHPSPLSARRGFFGSRPYSRANAFLALHNPPPVDWTPGA
ncbi:MAG: uracil-DNA glycosylase [Opitutaceae bacterium]|jgi:uracil-DNA glycosylase|nr:uracil-DNA glycosylase [Opitutaceae bacterium]